MSVFKAVELGSSLSVRGFTKMDKRLSVDDQVSFGSELYIGDPLTTGQRPQTRFGRGSVLDPPVRYKTSIADHTMFGSSLDVRNSTNLGSCLSVQSFSRLYSTMSVNSFVRIGTAFFCLSSGRKILQGEFALLLPSRRTTRSFGEFAVYCPVPEDYEELRGVRSTALSRRTTRTLPTISIVHPQVSTRIYRFSARRTTHRHFIAFLMSA